MENSSAGQDSSTSLEKQDGGFPKSAIPASALGFVAALFDFWKE